MDAAVRVCADALTDDWRTAVAERASVYVTEPTWNKLFQGRQRRRCRMLAEIAAAILEGKKKIHDLVGSFAARVASMFGTGYIEQRFARELASSISIPVVDENLAAVARGLQVTGILLCLVDGEDLSRCQCFIDLALAETQDQVTRILVAATDDWKGLGQFRSPALLGRD